MLKRIVSIFGLLLLSALLAGLLTAAAPLPVPTTTFQLLSGLPSTMNVGETATVVVQVTSDQEFLFAQMLPTFHFPGRGLMATNMGGDRVHDGTSASLAITFIAKNSTADLPDEEVCPTAGVAPVAFYAGARYPGGYIASQRFPAQGFYCVTVP
ncbi:MAG: hypothetical protein A2Z03_03255 [Chloroflexi bacterium RBG_16_56_8]|nr:MAG: hypothetical protein A2Z03_03255 [Chloroflexi bacterium RBG_16_56_8]